MAADAVQTRRWSREEYDRMVGEGFFGPEERLELVNGEIVQMTPQGSAHAAAVSLVQEALNAAFGTGYTVRVQMPLAVDPSSEPEPDVAIVRGSPRDYKARHPETAVLVVEVADTTLSYDRERKARLYASAGIPEYWVLNLLNRCLEIHRSPAPGSYEDRRLLGPGETVTPLASPQSPVAIDDLLP